MNLKKMILGKYPTSTIVGYILAGLVAFQQYYNSEMEWHQWLIPVLIAVLGRVVSDNLNSKDSDIQGGGIKNPLKP